MFGSFDISTSALVAQRTRLEAISANIANQHSLEDDQGNYMPFKKRMVIFAHGDPSTGNKDGVHVREIRQLDALKEAYEPGNVHANDQGYVMKPDIDSMMQHVNALEARRAYDANITAIEATKSMIGASLRILS